MSKERDSVDILRIDLSHVELSDFVASDELLLRSPLFDSLTENERSDLLRLAKVRRYIDGAVILEEGQEPQDLYFVLDGVVSLALRGGATDLGTLGKGDIFGLAAVDASAVCPSATARGPTRIALLSTIQVEMIADTVPRVSQLIKETAARRKSLADEAADFFDKW